MNRSNEKILGKRMNAPVEDIDIIKISEEFQALRSEWRELWVRAKGLHHESFDVCWIVWDCVAKRTGKSLRIVTARRNGKLIAVWPLVRSRNRLWTMLRPLGPDSADYTTILVDPEHSSDKLIESIWFAARKQCASDIILLPFLDCESHLYRLAMEHDGLVTHKEDPCAVARLSREVNWESFAASLGTLSGRKAGALRRRLERQGKVDVRVLGPEDGDNNVCMIDWMLASKRDWAERVDKKGQWLYSSIYRDYLIALANHKSEGEEACARILVLSMNDAPIAVCMVGMGKQSLLGIMNSFDRQHAKLAPGAIAMEAWVRWAIEHGNDFDLGVGSETFKPYWSKGNLSRVSSIEIAHSAWGRVAYAMRDGASRLSAIRAGMRRGKVSAGPAKTHHPHGAASNANSGESDERPDEASSPERTGAERES
jgi:CelD/BcsL family acetyltransferase involved in cellulose biosynthesis